MRRILALALITLVGGCGGSGGGSSGGGSGGGSSGGSKNWLAGDKGTLAASSDGIHYATRQSGTSADTHAPSACMLISPLIMSTADQTIPNRTIVTKGAVFKPQEFRVQLIWWRIVADIND